MPSFSRLDRRTDLAGRPSLDVHPTISMTLWFLVCCIAVDACVLARRRLPLQIELYVGTILHTVHTVSTYNTKV
jgi:hypothetical protein